MNKNRREKSLITHARESRGTLGKLIQGRFDYAGAMKEFHKNIFSIDSESNTILQTIAKRGPLNENQIIKFSGLTRDSVRCRLSRRKNGETLIAMEFLNKRNGKRVGNFIKRKRNEQIYSLTLKGFLFSLAYVPFDDHKMVINFQKYLEAEFHTMPYFAESVIQAIKYNVAMFLFHKYIYGMILNKAVALGADFHSFQDVNPYHVKHTTIVLKLTMRQKYYLREIKKRYWIAKNIPMKLWIEDVPGGDLRWIKLESGWYSTLIWLDYNDESHFGGSRKKFIPGNDHQTFYVDPDEIRERDNKILDTCGITKYRDKAGTFWE